jgi:ribosomal protein L27
MSTTEKLDEETRILAAMAYGEASSKDVPEEMSALASILVRQRDARGYKDMNTFTKNEKSFSFVVSDGNVRYKKLMKASISEIEKNPGMSAAMAAAKNALSGGPDLSNGAYFWDGADIKSNYKNHFKVGQGIHFADTAHNIYAIKESKFLVVKTKTVVEKKNGKVVKKTETEEGRYDYVYESTAAFGGTIFWKFNPAYTKLNRAKECK